MTAPLTGRALAQKIADTWITHAPTGRDEEQVREVLQWRTGELAGRTAEHPPWHTRGTVDERLERAARDVRLLVSVLGCPGSTAEHDAKDIVGRLRDLEAELVALAALATAEENAVCYALATLEAEEAEAAE